MAVKLNLKVGTKLAVGSIAGIVLVVALVVTSIYSTFQIGGATNGLLQSSQTVDRMAESKRLLVEMGELYREALLATGVDGVDSATTDFTSMIARLDDLLAMSESDAGNSMARARMSKARELLQNYVQGWKAAVDSHRGAVIARVQMIELTAKLNKQLDDLRRSLKGNGSDNLIISVERATSDFYLASGKIWRTLLTGEVDQLDSCLKALDEASFFLDVAAQHPDAAVAGIGKVAIGTMNELGQIAELATKSVGTRDSTAATLLPIRDESNHVLDEALAAVAAANAAQYQVVDASIERALLSGVIFSVLVVATMIVTALFGRLSIGRPIGRIAGVLELLASGDRTVDVPFVRRGDEVGDVARAANIFKSNLVHLDDLAAQKKLAAERAESERKAAFSQLADSFESTVGRIVNSVLDAAEQLQSAAKTMSTSAEQTKSRSAAVATASSHASSNVEMVAAAAEELAASVSEIGRRVNESARIAGDATRDADITASKVSRLSGAAQKIGDIVGLISTIAEQTNLLALNATIEAARAGDAGKGFAVVASEVKSLAEQTSSATAEIARQIEEIQASTAESASAIASITETIGKMNEIASEIASAVEQQGSATRNIAHNVQQASAGTADVADNIGGVTMAATDASVASNQVLVAASNLTGQSGELRAEVEKFLERVRTA